MKEIFTRYLKECPVVAILRGITPEETPAVCDVLHQEGIRLLEIPLNSPNALESIAIAAKHCAGRQMVGAGTVLTPEQVIGVQQANGTFIISPNTSPDVIQETKRLGLLSIPGFFTASEAFVAQKNGADFLKLFPMILGAGYVKDLKAVITTPILAVGGVNAENLPEFLKVCIGAGIGSAIYKPGKPLAQIAADAKALVSAARKS